MDSFHPVWTWANLITAVRLVWALVLLRVGLEPDLLAAWLWPVIGLSLASLALDGLDGWVARRTGTASALGARFDLETDAFFILVLCLAAWQLGQAGSWVFLLGVMRYGFVLAGWLWPWLQRPLPESFRRKAICVVQVAALVLSLVPWLQPPLSSVVLAAALGLLAASFAQDSLWLYRQRGRESA